MHWSVDWEPILLPKKRWCCQFQNKIWLQIFENFLSDMIRCEFIRIGYSFVTTVVAKWCCSLSKNLNLNASNMILPSNWRWQWRILWKLPKYIVQHKFSLNHLFSITSTIGQFTSINANWWERFLPLHTKYTDEL